MENTKQQLVERIKSASNVLVTVGRNPSVDALSALLGLTLILNKQGKHAAAVFSGQVPSTIEFLQPEETIEKNTDSLRDFIIALDKNKADKLRYKVEDNVVRIFITPYKTSISQEDFEFSEGDFNIDVVIALGVKQQEDLDEAITAHGRILHDATVATINTVPDAGLGSINWYEPQASSLSELVAELIQVFGPNLLDEQIATALLTGIVAETERFSNDKTSSVTMTMSALLMKAGANQQLVASKLENQLDVNGPDLSDKSNANNADSQASDGSTPSDQSSSRDDGTIRIDHSDDSSDDTDSDSSSKQSDSTPPPSPDVEEAKPEISTSPPSTPAPAAEPSPSPDSGTGNNMSAGPKLMTEPPTLGGTLTANSGQPDLEPATDPLSVPNAEADQLLEHSKPTPDIKSPDLAALTPLNVPTLDNKPPAPSLTPPPPDWAPPPPPPSPPLPPPPSPQPLPPRPTPAAPPVSLPPPLPPSTPAPLPSPPDDNEDLDSETLADIEQAVASPHVKSPTIDAARDEVKRAYNESPAPDGDALPPIDGLNAQPLGGELHPNNAFLDSSKPPQATDSTAPPPVPPPIPFQFGNSSPPSK